MKNMKKFWAFVVAVVVVIASIGFIRHERRQSSEIIRLREEVRFLSEEILSLNATTEVIFAKTKSNSDAETFRQNCRKYATGVGV